MKNKKDFSKKFELICVTVALLIGILLLIGSMETFYLGWHNIDLSFNNCLFANDLKIDFRQMNESYDIGKSMPVTGIYIIGMQQIQKSIITSIIWSILIGLSIMHLFNMKDDKRNN